MSIEGQGHFFTIYFPCFVLYLAKISGERYRTIGPLVTIFEKKKETEKGRKSKKEKNA